jgi:hypothetical protein
MKTIINNINNEFYQKTNLNSILDCLNNNFVLTKSKESQIDFIMKLSIFYHYYNYI